MNEIVPRSFPLNCDLLCHPEFVLRAINTVNYGSESLSFLGPEIWETKYGKQII